MCALHVSPLPVFRGSALPAAGMYSVPPNRSRPDQFPPRGPAPEQFSSEQPFAKRRRMGTSPQSSARPLQTPMRSYQPNGITSRTVQHSGSYPAMKTHDPRPLYHAAPMRPNESYDVARSQRRVLQAPPKSSLAASSLPGLSSLLQSSGSPPQPRPMGGMPRLERNASWSSNASPTESPLVSRGGAPHWGHAVAAAHASDREREMRETYGQYYQHQQRLSQAHLRDQYYHSLNGARTTSPVGSASPSSVSGDELNARHRVPSSSSSSNGAPAASKNSRYLREMDRRAILERLANGEKQAALAKEFQVSRAAICNLNKHRDEVMSRADENPFAKHPKKRKVRSLVQSVVSPAVTPVPTKLEDRAGEGSETETATTTTSTPTTRPAPAPRGMAAVHVVQSRAVQLLMTTLRSHVTPLGEFRRCSERVMRLVIEDALALVPTKPVDVYLNDQVKVEGVGLEHAPCGISMEQRHCPMLDMFHLVEPDQPTAYVRVTASRADHAPPSITLLDAHLPASLRFHNVFLFDLVAASSETLCATIQQLKNRGAIESMIHVVALFVASDVVASVQCTFPGVRLVTAQIDANLGKKTARATHVDAMLARFAQVYSTAV